MCERVEEMKRLLWGTVVLLAAIGVFPDLRRATLAWVEIPWQWLGSLNGAESNSATVRNIGLVMGAVIAFYLSWRRIRAADRQAHAAHKQLLAASDSLRESEKARYDALDRDRVDQSNRQFYKAAEMLTSDQMIERLIGIRILKDLAESGSGGFDVQISDLLDVFVQFPPLCREREWQGEAPDQRPDVREAYSLLAGLRPHNDRERAGGVPS